MRKESKNMRSLTCTTTLKSPIPIGGLYTRGITYFGETEITFKRFPEFFLDFNLDARSINQKPLQYQDIVSTEIYAKNNLRIVTNNINGTYYMAFPSIAKDLIPMVQDLLAACVEEGCFGSKAQEIFQQMQSAIKNYYTESMCISLAILVAGGFIWWNFNTWLGWILASIAFTYSNQSQKRWLRILSGILDVIILLVMLAL